MRFVLLAAVAAGSLSAQIIDHTCTDLESIPGEWIDLVQSSIDSHYAHTSHGSQLTWGLHFVEEGNPFYAFIVGNGYLPSSPTAYCVFDGQEGEGYVTPDLYWETEDGLQLTRDVLDNNPSISTSMWCWCCQCDYYSQEQVQGYLDAMSLLEGEYPEVTFIYFTGNAQSEGSSGYNRHMRNQQIRAFCQANDRVLFDFEDLDCWWYNPSTSQWERNTYSYNGQEIPSEHPEFSGDEYGHTTAESCEQKGRAWWFMTALQAGWPGMGVSGPHVEQGRASLAVRPNPARGAAVISLELPGAAPVRIRVLDLTGRVVYETGEFTLDGGLHEFTVPAAVNGVFLVAAEAGTGRITSRFAAVE